jgi:hypothetical protein
LTSTSQAEGARVLKPGRRLVLTTWEAPPLDYADLLAAAGLQVLVREETPSWLSRQLTFPRLLMVARK